MNPLLLAQWRSVRWSFAIFTFVGAVVAPLAAGRGIGFQFVPPNCSPWSAMLAASIIPRLLARQDIGPDAVYWHALPISRARRLWTRTGTAAALVAISHLIQYLAWCSPLGSALFRWTFQPDTHMVVRGALTLGDDGLLHMGFAQPEFLGTTLFVLLVFGATTFFAGSLERASSAAQAGLPGYVSGLCVWSMCRYASLRYAPWLTIGVSTLAAALGLLAGTRLMQRRGLSSQGTRETILGKGTRTELVWHLLGQSVFVLVPLLEVILLEDANLSPTPNISFATRLTIGCGVILLLSLPTTWREIRTRGRTLVAKIGIGLLRISLAGLVLWRVFRRQSSTVSCKKCRLPRLARMARCPACGSHLTAYPGRGWLARLPMPDEPWPIALVSVPCSMLVLLVMSWIPPERTSRWRVETNLPGVGFRKSNSDIPRPFLEGDLACPKVLSDLDFRGVLAKSELDHPSPFQGSEVRESFWANADKQGERNDWDAFMSLELPVPGDSEFELVARGGAVWIRRLEGWRNSGAQGQVWRSKLEVSVPELDQLALESLDAIAANRELPRDRAALAALNDPFFTVLVLEMTKRMEQVPRTDDAQRRGLRASFHRTLEDIVRAGIDPGTDRDVIARNALDELHARAQLEEGTTSTYNGSQAANRRYYSPLLRLALSASPEFLERKILDRDVFAAAAAGIRKDRFCAEACERVVRDSCRDTDSFGAEREMAERQMLAAASSLLAIDPNHGVETLLQEMRAHPALLLNSRLDEVLAYCGSPKGVAGVRAVFAATPASSGGSRLEWWEHSLARVFMGAQPDEYWLGW